jgi:serine protease
MRLGLLSRRPAAVLAALITVTLLPDAAWSAPDTPPPSPPDAEVAAGLEKLRAEVVRVAAKQRQGPAPIDDVALARLIDEAAAANGPDVCAATNRLSDFGTAVDAVSATIRDQKSREAIEAVAAYDVLVSTGAGLRGNLLGDLPDEQGCAGPVVVTVDPAKAAPDRVSLPGLTATTIRPLAAISDTDGVTSTFVADELVVGATGPAVVEAFAARWKGAVLRDLAPRAMPGRHLYLVRVNTGAADTAGLSGRLGTLNAGATKAEALSVSSRPGLELLAVAAAEKAGGLEVAVNWVSSPGSFDGRDTQESPVGPYGFTGAGPYDRNSFSWLHLNSGGEQAIGVTEAWRLLDAVDAMSHKTKLAILDQGFKPRENGDLPDGWSLDSTVPFVDAESPGWGGGSAAWHGTQVASAAAGVPGNQRGAAGPGGPVSDVHMLYTTGDVFLVMAALDFAILSGDKVMSMSFSTTLHWSMTWAGLPLEGYFAAVSRFEDVIFLASAGNDGRSVDSTTCAWLLGCWETRWHLPCENTGVRCVGGLGHDTRNRHGGSNFGSESVDIYAPYTVLAGYDPNRTRDGAYSVSGTSFSAPYVAGVIALIWAANPQLTSDQVETILQRTTRQSPDTTVGRKVVNAYEAVVDALRPQIAIKTPDDGEQLAAGRSYRYTSVTHDDGLGAPAVTWRANGASFGTGTEVAAAFRAGRYEITATAVFPNGTTVTDRATVTVVNRTPAAQVITPRNADGSVPVFDRTEQIAFRADSSDPDTGGRVPDNLATWHLDGAATPFATGHEATRVLNAAGGDHTVTFRACDTSGACAEDRVTVRLRDPQPNRPPVVRISNPVHGATLQVNVHDGTNWHHQITLGSAVTDPDGDPVTLVWTDSVNGGTATVIGSGAGPAVRLIGLCESTRHRLTLTATDTAGNVRQDAVEVSVRNVC